MSTEQQAALGLAPGQVDAIVSGDCGDPFALLGPHALPDGKQVVRVFLPSAESLALVGPRGGKRADCVRIHPAGLWAGVLRKVGRYRLRAQTPAGTITFDDAYRFGPVLGELDVHLLAEGTHLYNQRRLGAHAMAMDDVAGIAFAVWAPNARRVSVIGDFCNWDGRRLPMRKRLECGVWELFVPEVGPGALYKFELKGADGRLLPPKADPYAFRAELPPRTASIVHAPPQSATDDAWLARRPAAQAMDAPISIYEVHLGSWRRGQGNRYLSYDELADTLVPYVQELGFTHVELMPVSAYPFDGSWGYQPVGLYAPTARFGTPEQFAALIARFHAASIGVLLDWVPGHFPTDPHGLGWFDGTHLYEHADPRQGFQHDWNTLIFNFGRREVRSYLLGNALFWLQQYGADGLRVDAVASMLYLDYSRRAGEWVPNRHGGRENLEAIAFLKAMNERVFADCPGATTIAEESTAWPGVSQPTGSGGLGFGYKWNMGWMHDTLAYMREDPINRRWHHDKLTFGLIYAFHENFILPLSHDEVVHGKSSLVAKMPGDRWQRFANLRAYLGFMWSHPGKKLLFMGGELAQEREWNHDVGLDWHLLDRAEHRGMQQLVRDLNHALRELPALHRLDTDAAGFEWVVMDDNAQSVLAFLRRGHAGDAPVLVVCNFTPVPRSGYRVGVCQGGFWRECVNTDAQAYGGSGMGNLGGVQAEGRGAHGRSHSLALTLPPLATLVLEGA